MKRARRMFNVALQNNWLERNPFAGADRRDPLISAAEENERIRILSREEEERLLAACALLSDVEAVRSAKERGEQLATQRHGKRYEHLRPIVITALDTAMRKSELFKLTVGDVFLDKGVVRIRKRTTKTMKSRLAPITKRMRAEIEPLVVGRSPDDLVFCKSDVKNSFSTVLEQAKITDFKFHDLRHTAITWMLEAGERPTKVMKISGHTNWKTFLIYVNISEELARSTAQLLDEYRARLADAAGRSSPSSAPQTLRATGS